MRILVLASDNPSPPINGTRIRNYHLWPILRGKGHDVRILALTRNPADLSRSSEQIEFFSFTRKNILSRIWMRLFHSYHEWPVSDEMSARVTELQDSWKPDIIHAEELRMGYYLPTSSKTLTSLCVHNVESDLIKKTRAAPFRFCISFFNRLYQKNLMSFERVTFRKAKIRLTYSEVDRKRYQELYPEYTFELSSNGVNKVDLNDSDFKSSPENILFLGSLSYLPNVEGLFWFIDEIMPLLASPISLTVAGSTPTEEVRRKLARHRIPLIDTPLDLRPVYLSQSLLIVPLLSGSGTRGKILESLMYGRPVLTTPKGVEGLELSAHQGILVAQEKTQFARKLEEWLSLDQEKRETLALNGRKAMMERYTWEKVAEALVKTWGI
jgi:glycosyltransferase involved in cell wall biosynthesis